VRAVTVGAVLGYISVLVDERPLVLHVTASAYRLDLHPLEVGGVRRVMRIVAVSAGHLVLRHRMVGELGKFHLDRQVAGNTDIILLGAPEFLLRALVEFVAGEAADFALCVDAAIPVGQVRGRSC